MIEQELSGFLGLPDELTRFQSSRVVVVPVPFEATTSYGGGTKYGPDAIIEASHQVEFFDEQLACEPCNMGIFTEDPIDVSGGFDTVARLLRQKAVDLVKADKFALFLGGEHSITAPIVEGIFAQIPQLSVLHFDAHADLRDSYEGLTCSHASVMRRVFEMGVPFCSVGIRSFSKEEYDLINKHDLNIFYAHNIRSDCGWMDEVLNRLSDVVYITFDIDAVDISEVRATGTPEPGGLLWHEIITFLKKLAVSGKKVIAADLVELAPQDHDHTSSFYAARLAYKIVTYCTWQHHKVT
ncbi:MAG: agmatinase [Candidatus Auribacterota bacterium]|jgi:agmatinase|nr:agmatinase [Candidatus Auribacterota bacterium]